MSVGRKLHTTRCRKPVSIGDAWLCVEHIHRGEDGGSAVVAYRDPERPSPSGKHFFRGGCIPLGERRELTSGVHITIDTESVRSRVKLTIEAPKSVPITNGFPREREAALVTAAS